MECNMEFLLGFIGAIFGIIVVITVIGICILKGVGKMVGVNELKTIIGAAKNAKQVAKEDAYRTKSVSGITKLLEPEILRDFPDFNKGLLYSVAESNLRKIFSAIENKSLSNIENDNDLILLLPKLREEINDLKERKVEIKYDDIIFHEYAIKNYIKSRGMATIEISTTLEYYYKNSDKKDDLWDNIKRQTRYTCQFVYIYDEKKLEKKNKNIIVINCPNCGAPLRNLEIGECEYCTSHFEPINLKLWKMSSYKEDYK